MEKDQYLAFQEYEIRSIYRNFVSLFVCLGACISLILSSDANMLINKTQGFSFIIGQVGYLVLLFITPILAIFFFVRITLHQEQYEDFINGTGIHTIKPTDFLYQKYYKIESNFIIIFRNLTLALCISATYYKSSIMADLKYISILFGILFFPLILWQFPFIRQKVYFCLCSAIFIIIFIFISLLTNTTGLERSPNLSFSNIRDVALNEVQLPRINAHRISIVNADLSLSNFIEGNFTQSKIQDVDFVDANLNRSDFALANIVQAIFWGTELKSSSFIGASIKDSRFLETDLSHSDFTFSRISDSKFNGGSIIGGSFDSATLENVSFIRSDLSGRYFSNTTLRDVRFHRTKIDGAKFFDLDLTRTRGLTQDMLDTACGDRVKIPEGLVIRKCR